MSLIRCPYCEQGNPAESRFCNACGGALHLPPHLASCPRCGTVNPVTADVCCWCRGQLPGRRAGALVPVSPAPEVSRSLPRPRSQVIIGIAVLATVVLGYYAYRQLGFADAPQAPAASSEASGRGSLVGAGFIGRDAVAGDTKSASDDSSAGLTGLATSPPGTPLAAPVRAAANQPRAGRQPVKSQEAKASEPGPFRSEACTEAAAALGLCATKSAQKKDPETAAVVEAAIKRPQTTGAGNAGAQEPPRPQTCTEAVAALGLCVPKPTQRRE
jgi:hypothetical protein